MDFILTFDINDNRIGHWRYFLPTSKAEDYEVMINGKNLFDQAIKDDLKTYDNIWKIKVVLEIITQLVVC